MSAEAQQQLWLQLGLSEAQKKRAKAIQDESRGKVIAAMGDRDAMRAAFREGQAKFEEILTPAQKAKLPALRAALQAQYGGGLRGGTALGTVYLLKDGKPSPVAVRVGASDATYTEIRPVAGGLKEGDQVITGGGPPPKVQSRSMMPGVGGNQRR